ncbi:hypothetical protein [Longispora albida]|uniref:hypothetical protein n=1 Tax=Longispora albida TaxID=203523 RepID=UPI00036E2EF4|nr:hypothetical protein [Longispora albida]
MKRRHLLSTLVLAGAAGALGTTSPATAASTGVLPSRVPLPGGFAPEGIAIRGATFYTGSLTGGAIYRGDLVSGEGSVLVPGWDGGCAIGMHTDPRGRLWVARGWHGYAEVLDGRTGSRLAKYPLTGDLANTFVNDCVITRDAVYFTDSGRACLYVVPLGPGGRLPSPGAVRTIELTGGAADVSGFNNGIEVLPDGRLILVQMLSGKLFTVDPRTGQSTVVDTGGASLAQGDGLVLRGANLYVCQNYTANKISVVELSRDARSGRLTREITDPRFDSPSTIAPFGPHLYAVNARFLAPQEPSTTYELLRVHS